MEELIVNMTAEEILRLIYEALQDDNTANAEELAELLTDGNVGNTDIEKIFIYEPYDPGKSQYQTVYQELSSRLALIDRRLDCTNEILTSGFGFIGAFCCCLISFKFFGWIYNILGV